MTLTDLVATGKFDEVTVKWTNGDYEKFVVFTVAAGNGDIKTTMALDEETAYAQVLKAHGQ